MKEISILSLLNKQKEANQDAYQEIYQAIEQDKTLYEGSWTGDEDMSDEQALLYAGFKPDSILERLGKNSSSILIALEKESPAKFYLEEDIKEVALSYGLKFLKTSDFQGDQKSIFINDIKSFLHFLASLEDKNGGVSRVFQLLHSSRFYLFSLPQTFEGKGISSSKPPLLFYNIGANIYYLVSTYDSYL
ncbi:hypothetical protein WJR50_21615 [Catalinimonas sp. 4WD22]|uniref:hypothetical protein n=1 Tax=Catalinimonas locisalis TaxID=3133978 RepID=UPI003100E9E4